MSNVFYRMALAGLFGLSACAPLSYHSLKTVADARNSPAILTDLGASGDSVGDILTFDQPLLDQQQQAIGNNSGICIRTKVNHSFQCQWTLTLTNGSIQVSGREFDQGKSLLAIVGGTGQYKDIAGYMESVNNGDGTFTQTLYYRRR